MGLNPVPKPSKRPKRRKRGGVEFARIYGSAERAAWVKASPCIVPGCLAGPCDNAHVISGGKGRKADARFIAPICHPHHNELHDGVQAWQAKYHLNLLDCAAAAEARWTSPYRDL